MIPTSVKNERSLWLQAARRAMRMASVTCMAPKTNWSRGGTWGGGTRDVGRVWDEGRMGKGGDSSPVPHPSSLFVSERVHRVHPRGPAGRVQAEPDPGERR